MEIGDDTLGARLKERWKLLLFGLPFGAIGIGFLVIGVIPHLQEWRYMQGWEPSQAQLSRAGVETVRGDDSTTYRAYADYTYSWQGQTYSGNRVSISRSSDNIGDFQQVLGQSLEAAYRANRMVPVWINPIEPAESVLNRDMRWGFFGFKMLFVFIFGGIGLGICAYIFRSSAGKTAGASSAEPWKRRQEWANAAIYSQTKGGLRIAWVFAAFWCLIAFPVGGMVVKEALQGNLPALVGLIFPVVGIGLVAWAVRGTLAWRRFGEAPLHLDPHPGAIGGQVGGVIQVRLPYNPDHRFRVTLNCLYSYMSGSGKDRKRSERLVWQAEGFGHTKARAATTDVEFLFDVEEGLPSSAEPAERYHYWQLHVHCDLPGVDFDRTYELPVFPTRARAQNVRNLSSEHAQAIEHREQAIAQVLDLRQIPGGVELYFPAFRNWGPKLAGMLAGGVFLGAGIGVGSVEGVGVLPVIFSLLGGTILLVFSYSLFSSLRVRMDGSGIHTVRGLFGLSAGRKHLRRDQVARLRLSESFSASSGARQTAYYKIEAVTAGGGSRVVGINLPGREAAEQALEAISLLTGYPAEGL